MSYFIQNMSFFLFLKLTNKLKKILNREKKFNIMLLKNIKKSFKNYIEFYYNLMKKEKIKKKFIFLDLIWFFQFLENFFHEIL